MGRALSNIDGDALAVVGAVATADLDVVVVNVVVTGVDLVVVVAVVPPSKSSLTERDIDIRHVRYMVRPDASNPTCSNNDLASVTSSYNA